jgi:hypothetical protein
MSRITVSVTLNRFDGSTESLDLTYDSTRLLPREALAMFAAVLGCSSVDGLSERLSRSIRSGEFSVKTAEHGI